MWCDICMQNYKQNICWFQCDLKVFIKLIFKVVTSNISNFTQECMEGACNCCVAAHQDSLHALPH